MTDTNITIGTVIHGTLRDEDLLPAFADELARVSMERFDSLAEVWTELKDDNDLSIDGIIEHVGENVGDLIHDLMDALQEYAPVHVYFGAIDGDGSDFGWWPQDALGDCETVTLT